MLNKEQKARVREAYSRDVWHGNDRMTDYCVGKVAALAEFPDGSFLPVEKESIEKDFCFGYSLSRYDTESYDAAGDMVHHARTSVDYFVDQNMKNFRRYLDALKRQMEEEFPREFCVLTVPYYDQPADSPLKGLSWIRATELLEALGGSAFPSEIPGKTFHWRGHENDVRVPTAEELKIIYDAYEAAAKEHEKKVGSYLKRYGLSKVNAWSYWQDE